MCFTLPRRLAGYTTTICLLTGAGLKKEWHGHPALTTAMQGGGGRLADSGGYATDRGGNQVPDPLGLLIEIKEHLDEIEP